MQMSRAPLRNRVKIGSELLAGGLGVGPVKKRRQNTNNKRGWRIRGVFRIKRPEHPGNLTLVHFWRAVSGKIRENRVTGTPSEVGWTMLQRGDMTLSQKGLLKSFHQNRSGGGDLQLRRGKILSTGLGKGKEKVFPCHTLEKGGGSWRNQSFKKMTEALVRTKGAKRSHAGRGEPHRLRS